MKKAAKYAFIQTIPVMLGYLFLGLAFGILLDQEAGLGALWAAVISITVYAGSCVSERRISADNSADYTFFKQQAYVLWSVIYRTVPQNGQVLSLYDFFTDRRNLLCLHSDKNIRRNTSIHRFKTCTVFYCIVRSVLLGIGFFFRRARRLSRSDRLDRHRLFNDRTLCRNIRRAVAILQIALPRHRRRRKRNCFSAYSRAGFLSAAGDMRRCYRTLFCAVLRTI